MEKVQLLMRTQQLHNLKVFFIAEVRRHIRIWVISLAEINEGNTTRELATKRTFD
jgi:hypothetical protein